MKAVWVVLTWAELEIAAAVGTRRNIESLRDGNKPHRLLGGHEDLPGWQGHIEGAAGESAVAKFLNRYWSGSVNTFKTGGDVGDVQVRTRSRHNFELIVRPKDRDEDWFVLVTGLAPVFLVHGCLRGGDAKRPEWSATHGGGAPAWFVPQSEMRPFQQAAA